MPTLSLVIVSYNVKHFLRQCLQSVIGSDFEGKMEIWVVDNNSSDGSVNMINSDFPEVKLITNKSNLGFSKANNQAIEQIDSDYTLILNPDTLLEEDTLSKCVSYMERNTDIGALGVKMIDGSGKYLPESKRGFPSPLNAIYKLSGLNRIFRKSALLNAYYMGHLQNDSTSDIDVLTGAFMMMPTHLLKDIGGFDEDYFMYGEDIELCYQVKNKGYRIVYFPKSKIVHFKGESTQKSSIRYIRNFYGAMHKYARKRNTGSGALWNLLIPVGIFVSAINGSLKNILIPALRPFNDIFIIGLSAIIIKRLWAQLYFQQPDYYQGTQSNLTIIVCSMIMVFCYYLFGQYDKRHNIKHLFLGFIFGSLMMLSVYSLLPQDLRFSRIILLLMAGISPILLLLTRKFYNLLLLGKSSFDGIGTKRIAVIGSENSMSDIKKIIESYYSTANIDQIDPEQIRNLNEDVNENLLSFVKSRYINELIFCSKDLSSQSMFHIMSLLGDRITYKIANDDNSGILGSDSKNRVGEWYTVDISFKIDQLFHRRLKRLFDLIFTCLILLLSPILLFVNRNSFKVLKYSIALLMGKRTLVAYIKSDDRLDELPALRDSVFELVPELSIDPGNPAQIHQANLYYARHYNVWMEAAYLYRALFKPND
ncbi:MAG: glycosyltransferase [Bacteroidia bacterium]|nr:glycosyltransferase [Bacteroidia bacterium]